MKTLIKYRGSIVKAFEELTRDDPLYPVLEPDLRGMLEKRHIQLLLMVDFCIVFKNKTDVLMDIWNRTNRTDGYFFPVLKFILRWKGEI